VVSLVRKRFASCHAEVHCYLHPALAIRLRLPKGLRFASESLDADTGSGSVFVKPSHSQAPPLGPSDDTFSPLAAICVVYDWKRLGLESSNDRRSNSCIAEFDGLNRLGPYKITYVSRLTKYKRDHYFLFKGSKSSVFLNYVKNLLLDPSAWSKVLPLLPQIPGEANELGWRGAGRNQGFCHPVTKPITGLSVAVDQHNFRRLNP
jgi:hypothetical protein